MLRSARLNAGLSRGALAATISTSANAVQCLEQGRRPPAVDVAERICVALALDPWRSAVLLSVAVDVRELRTRRGVRHVHPRGVPVPASVRERVAGERAAGRSWTAIAEGLSRDQVPTAERGQWWASSVSRIPLTETRAKSVPSMW